MKKPRTKGGTGLGLSICSKQVSWVNTYSKQTYPYPSGRSMSAPIQLSIPYICHDAAASANLPCTTMSCCCDMLILKLFV